MSNLSWGFGKEKRFARIKKKPGFGEGLMASFIQGAEFGESLSLVRAAQIKLAEREDDVWDADTLNEEFTAVSKPFTEPMSYSKAKLINRFAKDKRKVEELKQGGDPDSNFEAAMKFGMGMIPQILDPIGVGLSLALGGGITKAMAVYANRARKAAVAAQAIKGGVKEVAEQGAKEVAKQSLTRSMGEGVAGNVLSEAAFVTPSQEYQREEVDAYISIRNAVIAGMAFPGVIHGMKKSLQFTSAAINEKLIKNAEMQLQHSKRIDNEALAFFKAKDELPALRKRIDDMWKEKTPKVEQIEELEKLYREIDEYEIDRAAEIEKANSPEAGVHYDQEASARYKENLDKSFDDKDIDNVRQSLDELDEEVAILEKEGMDNEYIKEIEEVRQERGKMEELDRAIKAAKKCAEEG